MKYRVHIRDLPNGPWLSVYRCDEDGIAYAGGESDFALDQDDLPVLMRYTVICGFYGVRLMALTERQIRHHITRQLER